MLGREVFRDVSRALSRQGSVNEFRKFLATRPPVAVLRSNSRLFVTNTKPTRQDDDDDDDEELKEILARKKPVEEKKTPPHLKGFSDFVAELGGWYPFLGLLSAALVSKEIYHLGPEFLYGVLSSGVFFGGYVLAVDPAKEWARDAIQEDQQDWESVWKLYAAIQTEQIAMHKATISLVDLLKQVNHHRKQSAVIEKKYLANKAKHDARAAVLQQLEAYLQKERAVEKASSGALAKETRDYVRQVWSKPDPALKEEAFQYALDNLFDPKPQASNRNQLARRFYYKYLDQQRQKAKTA